MTRQLIACLCSLLWLLGAASAADVPTALPGTLVLHGGGALTDDSVAAFLSRAGGARAQLVVIPTAAERVDAEAAARVWRRRGMRLVTVLHTRSRQEADTPAFSKVLDTATAVWIGGGLQSRLERVYANTRTARAIAGVLKRGGVVGGSSAGAAAMSTVMIRSGKLEPDIGQGLGLLSGAIIDQHFSERGRLPRLKLALEQHPGWVGYGIDENTSLVIDGRAMRVAGPGAVHILLAANATGTRPARHNEMRAGRLGDHVAWRRAALARAGEDFPPASFPSCELPSGTVVLMGGGSVPRRGLEAFLRASGGKDARIVMIHTALAAQPPNTAADLGAFDKVGASKVKLLHARDREQAASEEFLAEIDRSAGVWFTGGHQWLLVDRYVGTPVEAALRRLLARGGAVGGTSAGATICGDYLLRGDPLHHLTMMAEGYERGLALLPGLAVDQHFTQRKRLPDLINLKRRFPQLLAMGIDETTAVEIKGSSLRVIGIGSVTVMSDPLPAGEIRRDEHFTVLNRGDRFDLKDRKILFRWPLGDR